MQELPDNSVLTVVYNARVWTGDTANPYSEALLLRGGRVAHAGSREEVLAMAQGLGAAHRREVDAEGASVLPGFVDAHVHLVDGGLRLKNLDLTSADTPDAFREAVRRYSEPRPADGGDRTRGERSGESGWLLGAGWDHERWDGVLPNRQWIDPLTASHPTLLTRSDLHMAVANSRALELAGIDATTPDPEGGAIFRDGDGTPTGVLVDRAIEMVLERIPEPSDAELDAAVDRAQHHALTFGVTQLHDMGEIPPSWRDLELLMRARDQGRLILRTHVATPLTEVQQLVDFIREQGRGDEWLWWGGVKGFVDGSLGAGTAWFKDSYADRPGRGITVTDLEELAEDIREADREGLQPIVHAIGDAAVEWLGGIYLGLEALNGPRDRRPRLEHTQHLTPGLEAMLGAAGIIAYMQPAHLVDDGSWMQGRIGTERCARAFAMRSLTEAGVPLAFGSDWTVASMNPLPGLEAACYRRPRGQKEPFHDSESITLDQALTAYTRGAATAGFSESFSGSLSAGKVADLVILDGDLLADGGEGVGERVVTRTFVAGQEMYTREGW